MLVPFREPRPAFLANEEALFDRRDARFSGPRGDEIVQLMHFFVAVWGRQRL
jgi:hypothetical protein